MNKHEYNKNTFKRARRVLEIAAHMAKTIDKARSVHSRIEEINLHFNGYADGSSVGESGLVATGNWNNVTNYDRVMGRQLVSNLPERIRDIFEKMGIECEWSDEWDTCGNCYRLIRTSPNSWSWQPNYLVSDGEITCGDCIKEDPSGYIEFLDGNDNACMTIDVDLEKHGYSKLNKDSFESGWFPGQTDDPKQISKDLRAKGINHFIFVKDENSQFYSKWSVWILNEDCPHDAGTRGGICDICGNEV